MTGKIFNVQKFCTHDGPGIRTTVFLKGCPLSCKWCHNPESLDIDSTMAFYSSKCRKCGRCLTVCEHNAINKETFEFDREKCRKCGKCIAKCLAGARNIFGYDETADNIIKEVLKDKIFYDTSGGGVTFSGGEPTFQSDFLLELCKKAKENSVHTAIETNFFADYGKLETLALYTDLFLTDIKIIDDRKHRYYCGVSNKIILENIRKVSDVLGKEMIFRVPLIPGINDSEEDLSQLAEFIKSLKNRHRAELMKYHNIGISKYEACGMKYTLNEIKPAENTDKAKNYLKSLGVDIEED